MGSRLSGIVLGLVLVVHPGMLTAQDGLVPAGRLLSGWVNAVDARGSLVFMGDGALLRVIDLSSPGSPVEVGSLELEGREIISLAVDENRVYVGTLQSLHVVDVTTPAIPVELGVLPHLEVKYGIAAMGDTVSYAGSQDLVIVDVRFPTMPTVIGLWSGYPPSDVKLAGDYAYVTTVGSGGLRILDLTDPSQPTQVGHVAAPTGNLDVSGNLVFVEDGSDGLWIFDVSDPTAPFLVADADLSPATGATDVSIQGDLAFVSTQLDGLLIIDVSDPQSPVFVGTAPPPIDRPNEKWIATTSIPEHAIVATDDHGIRVIEVTEPASPMEVAVIDSLGWTRGASVSNGVLVLASSRRGIWTIDVSDPSDPTPLANLSIGPYKWVSDVDVEGSLAVAVGFSFAVIDVSDPNNPNVVGETPLWEVQGDAVEIVEDLAYVANDGFGLRIVDISIPSNPTEIGSLGLTGGGFPGAFLDVEGSLVVYQGAQIEIVDVSNPAVPTWVSSIELDTGNVRGVALYESWLFVASGSGIHTFDVKDPTFPVETNVFRPPLAIASIGVRGSVLYVGSYFTDPRVSMIEAWDIGDPSNPVLMARRNGSGDVVDLALGKEHVFTARYLSGFESFTLCQGPLFADDFESGGSAEWSSTVP